MNAMWLIGMHHSSPLSARDIELNPLSDLNMNNFMMESKDMFPDGYHTQDILQKPDLSGPARYYTRTQRPPRYYIIDFGISRQYDDSNTSPREPVILGGDGTVPEFINPYEEQNPYWTDVYYAGNLVRQHFLEVLFPLLLYMPRHLNSLRDTLFSPIFGAIKASVF